MKGLWFSFFFLLTISSDFFSGSECHVFLSRFIYHIPSLFHHLYIVYLPKLSIFRTSTPSPSRIQTRKSIRCLFLATNFQSCHHHQLLIMTPLFRPNKRFPIFVLIPPARDTLNPTCPPQKPPLYPPISKFPETMQKVSKSAIPLIQRSRDAKNMQASRASHC